MTLSDTAEYRVSAKGFNAVKKICAKITNQESRRRAFKALLCMDALADYLYSQGFSIDISKNLYKIFPLNKEFEFTDIHCNGRFIDVVPVVNGQYVLIPKNHAIFDVVPDLYVVADYNQTSKKVKFLGCFEGNKIPKNVENGNHYVCDIKNLEPPAKVEELLSSVKPEELSEKSHGLFVSFFIDYLDGVLDDTSKKRLITHLIECKECRSELVEFFDYETIAKETKKFPEVLNDNTLDIIGAVAVNDPKYKDFKEYTIQIEKEKDEYEEDEEDENIDGKQIKSAIDDPLQILYGNNKNKKIFDLMGDRPKKTSMLDNVMSDIAKAAQKPVNQELTQEEKAISYQGTINPEYYAEGLPEGSDVDFEPQKSDLNLDLDFDYIPKKKKDENPAEILDAEEVINITDDNDFEPVVQPKETNILQSSKTDVDKPQFQEQLNPPEETPVSTTDELILLDDEKNVDEPEFIAQIKTQSPQKPAQTEELDDYITIEDDNDNLDILNLPKEENELPNSMDSIVYYEENEDENSAENDDLIEIIDEDNDVLNIEIPIEQPAKQTEFVQKAEDTPIINLHEELLNSILQIKDEPEEKADDDLPPIELPTPSSTEDLIVIDDNSNENSQEEKIEPASDETASVEVSETTDTLDIIQDEEEEISDDNLVHFDAVDLDIIDEEELAKPSLIPETIEDAGIAASSLIDDFEYDSKELIAQNVAKNITKDALDIVSQATTEQATDIINNISQNENVVSEIASLGDLLSNGNSQPVQSSTNTSNNTISVNDNQDDFLFFDEEDIVSEPNASALKKSTDNLLSVSQNTENYDDLLFVDDEPSTLINTNSVDDDFIVIDEDENYNLESFSIPTNANKTANKPINLIDNDKNEEALKFANNTNSVDDNDFIVIDEDENDNFNSFAIPTNVSNDDEDDFIIIDDDDTPVDFNKQKPSEISKNNIEDDMLIIDDEDDDIASVNTIGGNAYPSKSENDIDNDILIIDDEDDSNTSDNTISGNVKSLQKAEIEDTVVLNEEPVVEEKQEVQNEVSTPENQQVELNDDESNLLSFGDEDDTDFLKFDSSDDFVLEAEDDSFMLKEEPSSSQPISQPQEPSVQPQNEPAQPISAADEDDEDDLVIIDDDNLTPITPEKHSAPIDNTISVDNEDDDFIIIDDDNEIPSVPVNEEKSENVIEDAIEEDTNNFFRPAGASFGYNDNEVNNDFLVIDEEKPQVEENEILPLEETTENDDDMLILDEEDTENILEETEPVKEEENQENEVELVEEEEKPKQSNPQKPVSQLDLIFNSLSTREKEQIAAVQSGKAVKEQKGEKPSEEINNSILDEGEPTKETPKSTMFNKNLKDAISAKEEAVEEGRISLKPSEEPVVDPLINTTVKKFNREEYEEVDVDQETEEEHSDNEEEVEYIYEYENGEEYIPQDGEEVEYVYEDEDGNIISDVNDSEEQEKSEDNEITVEDDNISIDDDEEPEDSLVEDFSDISEPTKTATAPSPIAKEVKKPEKLDEIEDFDNFDEDIDDTNDLDNSEEEDFSDEENSTEEDNNGEEFENEDEEDANTAQIKKKAMIKKVVIAAAVALVLVGGGIATKVILTQTNARAEQQALNEGASIGETTAEEGGLSVPEDAQSPTGGQLDQPAVGGEEGGLSIPESDADALGGAEAPSEPVATKPQSPVTPVDKPTGPKAGTPNATTSDLNKAVANAFSESPTSMTVRKASWGVGASLAADASFKAYLQQMGKSVKSVLRKNLATVKGEAPANPVKIQIKMSDTGNLQDVVILKSSGNSQVDEIVLQSVKQSIAACPFPELTENTLKANQKATGGNTVKMSLTVTF